MQTESAIIISNLSKKYQIGKEKEINLRGALANTLRGKKSSNEEFWALSNINFNIKKGEVVGIIGKNGAGKSTLLKILSQITKPTSGKIEINGRIASLLEVGTGFHPELTGRENIYLNGTILGMSRKEVKAKFDEIVDFSGVSKFIDTPVKHYSSGMYVRLAFAVAANLEPEILIIDEVLAVGDAEFQKKCLGKMHEVAGKGRTVLFVSHNIGAVRQLCTSAIVLDKGKVVFSGGVDQCIDIYNTKISSFKSDFIEHIDYQNRIKINSFDVYSDGKIINSEANIDLGSAIEFDINLEVLGEISDLSLAFDLYNENDEFIAHLSNEDDACFVKKLKNGDSLSYSIQTGSLQMIPGSYYFNFWIGMFHTENLYEVKSIFSFNLDQGNFTKRTRSLPSSSRLYIPTFWKIKQQKNKEE